MRQILFEDLRRKILENTDGIACVWSEELVEYNSKINDQVDVICLTLQFVKKKKEVGVARICTHT